MARILFLTDTFPPNVGGWEKSAAVLARSAVNMGHKVAVFTPSSNLEAMEEATFDGEEPYGIIRSAVWKQLFNLGGSEPGLSSRLARLAIVVYLFLRILLIKCDLIVVGHVVPGGNIAGAIKKLRGTSIIMVTHGEEISVYSRGTRMRRMLMGALEAADVIRCTTEGNAAEIMELIPSVKARIVVQPPPLNLEGVPSAEQVEALRQKLSLRGKQVLLFVGRLVPRKGIDAVLTALGALAAGYPNLVFLVVGDGPIRDELGKMASDLGISERVVFTGRIRDTAPYYELCDIFVMPNRTMPNGEREGYGMVFAEAGFADKPVIGGRSGGAVDAIEDGITGLLVDPEDPQALAGTIRQLLDSPDRRMQMGDAGRRRALRLFSAKAVEVNFDHIIRHALERSKQ